MNDAVPVQTTFHDWVYDKQERVLCWIAGRLPRAVVYFATVRLWTEATETCHEKDDEGEFVRFSMSCAHALDHWNGQS